MARNVSNNGKYSCYAVGKKFPIPNPNGSNDCIKPKITGASFNLLYWIDKPAVEEIKEWRTGPFRYGVFVRHEIPFFLMRFLNLNWNLDVHFEIHLEIEGGTNYDDFLLEPGNVLIMYLIDASTNTLLGLRAVALELSIVTDIKNACLNQLTKYKNSHGSGETANSILKSFSTNQMMKMSRMHLIAGR